METKTFDDIIARVQKMAEKETIITARKTAARLIEIFIECIQEELLAGNSVRLKRFGVFEVVEKAEREGRNPRTGEKITIPKSRSVRFRQFQASKKGFNGEE